MVMQLGKLLKRMEYITGEVAWNAARGAVKLSLVTKMSLGFIQDISL